MGYGLHGLNQFDICAQLFGCYSRFVLLDKIGLIYIYWKPTFRQIIYFKFSFDIVSVLNLVLSFLIISVGQS